MEDRSGTAMPSRGEQAWKGAGVGEAGGAEVRRRVGVGEGLGVRVAGGGSVGVGEGGLAGEGVAQAARRAASGRRRARREITRCSMDGNYNEKRRLRAKNSPEAPPDGNDYKTWLRSMPRAAARCWYHSISPRGGASTSASGRRTRPRAPSGQAGTHTPQPTQRNPST